MLFDRVSPSTAGWEWWLTPKQRRGDTDLMVGVALVLSVRLLHQPHDTFPLLGVMDAIYLLELPGRGRTQSTQRHVARKEAHTVRQPLTFQEAHKQRMTPHGIALGLIPQGFTPATSSQLTFDVSCHPCWSVQQVRCHSDLCPFGAPAKSKRNQIWLCFLNGKAWPIRGEQGVSCKGRERDGPRCRMASMGWVPQSIAAIGIVYGLRCSEGKRNCKFYNELETHKGENQKHQDNSKKASAPENLPSFWLWLKINLGSSSAQDSLINIPPNWEGMRSLPGNLSHLSPRNPGFNELEKAAQSGKQSVMTSSLKENRSIICTYYVYMCNCINLEWEKIVTP